jgi:CBS domain containing-hemolysin-like protein
MSGEQIIYLVILGVCILASGFFSGSETALVSVPRERVEQLAASDRRARPLRALLEEPEAMLSTLLVANNFVNILGASVATVLFVDLLGHDWGPWAATGAVTAVILIAGEITPKSLASRFPDRFALAVAPTIWRLSRVLRPIAKIFVAIARGLFRLFRVGAGHDRSAVTGDDIRAMAVLGERVGNIDAAQREIIHSLFELTEQTVRDVMTPRTDLDPLVSPVTIEAVRAAVAATGRSRFPVIKDSVDELVGVLQVKDLIGMPSEPTTSDIHRVIRDPVYVPESKSVLDLLMEMQRDRFSLAVVTDEHGGIEGIVTITDLISQLVGELQDEYDTEDPSVLAIGSGEWLVDGRTPIEDVSEAIEVYLPTGEYTTVAGLVLDQGGRVPLEGDTVTVNGITIEVVSMVRNRVDKVRIVNRG